MISREGARRSAARCRPDRCCRLQGVASLWSAPTSRSCNRLQTAHCQHCQHMSPFGLLLLSCCGEACVGTYGCGPSGRTLCCATAAPEANAAVQLLLLRHMLLLRPCHPPSAGGQRCRAPVSLTRTLFAAVRTWFTQRTQQHVGLVADCLPMALCAAPPSGWRLATCAGGQG